MADDRCAAPENAADLYALAGVTIAEEDWEALACWECGEPLSKLGTMLARNRESIDRVEAASFLPHCRFPDFGQELGGRGRDSLMLTRRLSRLLMADALSLLEASLPDRACDRLAAIIRVGRHSGAGRVIMPMLVGAGIIDEALDFILELEAQGRVSQPGRDSIKSALALIGDDPFDLRACIAAECALMQERLRARRSWFRRRGPLTSPIERAPRAARVAMAAQLGEIAARICALPLLEARSADAISAIEDDLPIWTELVGPIFRRGQTRSLEVAERCREARQTLGH